MAIRYRDDFHPVKRPGALTAKARRAGEGVQEFADEHKGDSGLTGEQARFAVNSRHWHRGGHHDPRSKGY